MRVGASFPLFCLLLLRAAARLRLLRLVRLFALRGVLQQLRGLHYAPEPELELLNGLLPPLLHVVNGRFLRLSGDILRSNGRDVAPFPRSCQLRLLVRACPCILFHPSAV